MPPGPQASAQSPYNQYGYTPSLAVGIAGIVVFGLSGVVHTWQMAHYKVWWMSLMIVGALTEVIGYIGRIFSHQDPYSINPFLAQIVTLIIAPAFFSAALYVVLMRMCVIVGRQYSPIPPVAYIWIFSSADVLSLVIQAIGGGMASQGQIQKNQELATRGTRVMVGGICWQMLTMVVFVLFALVFVVKVRMAQVKLSGRLKWFAAGMTLVTVCIFIRCIYRTVELLEGWTGYIITHEVFFIGLELVPMAICVWAFNLFHPGAYLPDAVVQIDKPAADTEAVKEDPELGAVKIETA